MTRIVSEENPLLWMLMTVKAASAGRSGAVGKAAGSSAVLREFDARHGRSAGVDVSTP
jgi:hypothetical protein